MATQEHSTNTKAQDVRNKWLNSMIGGSSGTRKSGGLLTNGSKPILASDHLSTNAGASSKSGTNEVPAATPAGGGTLPYYTHSQLKERADAIGFQQPSSSWWNWKGSGNLATGALNNYLQSLELVERRNQGAKYDPNTLPGLQKPVRDEATGAWSYQKVDSPARNGSFTENSMVAYPSPEEQARAHDVRNKWLIGMGGGPTDPFPTTVHPQGMSSANPIPAEEAPVAPSHTGTGEGGLEGEFIPAGTAPGSPGNNPGGAVSATGGEAPGIDTANVVSALQGNAPNAAGGAKGATVGEVGTDYGTSVAQPGVKAADAAMAVRSDDALVENRMKGLLSEGGDWKRMAEHSGSAMANRRGLKDSSISGSAAYGEAIKAALLIAQQDARTTATYDLADQANNQQTSLVNAGAENTAENLGYQTERGIEGALQTADQAFKQKGELNNQAFANETSLTAQKGDIESGLQTQRSGDEALLIGQRGDIETNLQNLKTQNAKDLLGIENEYKQTIATNSNASAIMQTYVNEIGDLMAADKKFTAEQIAERVRTLKSSLQGSLQVLSGVSGMDWTRFSIPGVAGPVGQNADVTNSGTPAPSILSANQASAVDAFLAAQGQPT